MYWPSVLAVLGLAATAVAQGSAGGDQSSCSEAQAFIYSGCYNTAQNGRHAGFPWQLSGSTTDAKYYPGYVSGQVTVTICLRACRGHGFKWAALFFGTECYCSVAFPLPTNPASTTLGPQPAAGTSPGTRTAESNCGSSCQGDPTQKCGGGDAAVSTFRSLPFPFHALIDIISRYESKDKP